MWVSVTPKSAASINSKHLFSMPTMPVVLHILSLKMASPFHVSFAGNTPVENLFFDCNL